MNKQQAYITGFVKRAADYGYDRKEAFTLLKEANRLRDAILSGEVSPESVGGLNAAVLSDFDEASKNVFSNKAPASLEGLAAHKNPKALAEQLNKEKSIRGAGEKIKGLLNATTDKAPSSSYLASKVAPERSLGLAGKESIFEQKERARLAKALEDRNVSGIWNDVNLSKKVHSARGKQISHWLGDQPMYSAAKGTREVIHPPASGIKGALGKLKAMLRRK